MEQRIIRAVYDENTITVYQAYNMAIARAAVKNQTFASPFKMDRMTWIKPSFLWMMYRAGWGTKENQERILAVRMKRSGFEKALSSACLSSFDASVYPDYETWQEKLKASPVRIQWDPEKDILLRPLNYKSIQIGLSGGIVHEYVNSWIVGVDDITDECQAIHLLVLENKLEEAAKILPAERPYILPADIAKAINADACNG